MVLRRVPHLIALVAMGCLAGPARAEPTWTIAPPVVKGEVPPRSTGPAAAAEPAPRRKEEARIADEIRRIPIDTIYVEGRAESDGAKAPPQTKEQRFSAALNAGNPEVSGGKMRHGTFYDNGVYWGADPLSFVYYNIVNRFKD